MAKEVHEWVYVPVGNRNFKVEIRGNKINFFERKGKEFAYRGTASFTIRQDVAQFSGTLTLSMDTFNRLEEAATSLFLRHHKDVQIGGSVLRLSRKAKPPKHIPFRRRSHHSPNFFKAHRPRRPK